MAIKIKFPMLQAPPNNGYDENDRWMGMTEEEVAKWLEKINRHFLLRFFEPRGRPH